MLLKLKEQLELCLQKNLPSRLFLDRFRVIEEESRKTAAYNDPAYLPFYYWLGTLIEPKAVLEIGFRLGLCSGCFLKSCKSVSDFTAFQRKGEEYYSPRLARSNLKEHYKGQVGVYHGGWMDEKWQNFIDHCQWDLVIVNEEVMYDEHKSYLESVWPRVKEGGLVVMDYITRHKPSSQAYADFCKSVNRPETRIATRYGLGLITK